MSDSKKVPDSFIEEFKQDSWYKSRPECIKVLIDLFPPHKLVKIKSTGQIGQVYSYSENNTITLTVPDRVFPEMQINVFGLSEEHLEVCNA